MAEEPLKIEIIPDGDELVFTISTDVFTASVRGWTKEIESVARAVLAAESRFIPAEWLPFARDVLARRNTRLLIPEPGPDACVEIADDRELGQAQKSLDAGRKLRSLFRAVFHEALSRLQEGVGQFERKDAAPLQ